MRMQELLQLTKFCTACQIGPLLGGIVRPSTTSNSLVLCTVTRDCTTRLLQLTKYCTACQTGPLIGGIVCLVQSHIHLYCAQSLTLSHDSSYEFSQFSDAGLPWVTSFETPSIEPELPPKHHLPKHG